MASKNHERPGGTERSVGLVSNAQRCDASNTYTTNAHFSRVFRETQNRFHSRWLKSRKNAWRLVNQRVREIERLIQLRHGGPVDTDDGRAYLVIVANCLVHQAIESNASRNNPLDFGRMRLTSWAAKWTPLVPLNEVVALADRVIATGRRFYRADTAARILGLHMTERTALGITTIGAVDCPKAEREKARKARKRDRQRERDTAARREAGKQTRDEYVGESVSEKCRRLDISRQTYYRRAKAGVEGYTLSGQQESLESHVGQSTCNPPSDLIRKSPPPPAVSVVIGTESRATATEGSPPKAREAEAPGSRTPLQLAA